MMVYFLNIIIVLLICSILTIVIEYIPIVCFLKISKKYFIVVNVLSNVLLNIILIIFDITSKNFNLSLKRDFVIYIFEIIVVVVEIVLYDLYLKHRILYKKSKKEFNISSIKNIFFTLTANILSFIIGLIINNF